MSLTQSGDGKSPLFSKTLGFNFSNGVLIPAIWPFLPEHFRHHEYAIPCVTAWLTVSNIVLRLMTSEAIKLWNAK